MLYLEIAMSDPVDTDSQVLNWLSACSEAVEFAIFWVFVFLFMCAKGFINWNSMPKPTRGRRSLRYVIIRLVRSETKWVVYCCYQLLLSSQCTVLSVSSDLDLVDALAI